LNINNLIVLIMNFKSSVQRELNNFFKVVSSGEFEIRTVTKGAFTQARAKLNPWAFIRLNEVANQVFYTQAPFLKWHEFRLLAADGTTLMLPNHPTVVQEFGQYEFGPKADVKRCMALSSTLYDPLNLMTIDAQIAPYSSSENELLLKHLEKVGKGDLLLLDRGYPCFWLLFLLTAKEADFCVRLKASAWNIVEEFTKSNDKQRIVNFKLPDKDRSKLADYPDFEHKEITCRLVKIELSTGEIEVLCTSLMDEQTYPISELDKLYHTRWGIEESYKMLKTRVELENFSGKTAKSVKQDFHARILLMTLCAAYAHPIEQRVVEEFKAGEKRKYDQKINRTDATSETQNLIFKIIIGKIVNPAISLFDKMVYKSREIIRPNRSNPRNHKQKKTYSMNMKRL